MNGRRKIIGLLLLSMAWAQISFAVDVTVDSRCNIYGAGHLPPNDAPTVGSQGGGLPPVAVPLAQLGNASPLTFQAGGFISFCLTGCGTNGPEGTGVFFSAP